MRSTARRQQPVASDIEVRLASLHRAISRRERLESLFADAEFLNSTLVDGRYLRLCGAIAWASAREEQARRAVETDRLVGLLRDSVAPVAPR